MAKRRMTKSIQEAVLNNVIKALIAKSVLYDLEATYKEVVFNEYLKNVPPLGKQLLTEASIKDCLYTTNTLNLNLSWDKQPASGVQDTMKMLQHMPYTDRPLYYGSNISYERVVYMSYNYISLTPEIEDILKKACIEWQKIDTDITTMHAYITSFKTVEDLLEASPTLRAMVPEAERPNAPLISLETQNKAAHILSRL